MVRHVGEYTDCLLSAHYFLWQNCRDFMGGGTTLNPENYYLSSWSLRWLLKNVSWSDFLCQVWPNLVLKKFLNNIQELWGIWSSNLSVGMLCGPGHRTEQFWASVSHSNEKCGEYTVRISSFLGGGDLNRAIEWITSALEKSDWKPEKSGDCQVY